MTFFLPERTPEVQAEADAIFAGKPPSFGDRLQAQAEATRIQKDLNDRALRVERDVVTEFEEAIGPEFITQNPPDPRETPLERRHDALFEGIRRAQVLNPGKFTDLPTSIEDFEKLVTERRRAEFDEAQEVLSNAPPGSWAAELTGDLWAELTNPQSLATLAVGASPGAGIARTALTEGMLAAFDEGRTLGDQFQVADDLGTPQPAPVSQVATAFGVGAGLGGAVAGALRFAEIGRTRARTTGERRPADQGQIQFDQDVQAAQNRMEQGGDFLTGRPAAEQAEARPEPGTLAALTGPRMGDFDFTASGNASPQTNRIGYVVGKLLALGYEPHHAIGLTANLMQESGPGLNTRAVGDGGNAFGMGQWNGPRRRQYLAFAQRKGRDAGDLDTQIEFLDWELKNTERGAAAKILNTNNARDAAIMASNEFWRPGIPHLSRRAAFADALAQQFEAGQVPKWEGARSPAQGGSGDFSAFDTRRGFTGQGQVTAGDDIRIDVEYQVVDASDLIRASGDLQPRDRSRASSDEQISEIAAQLDPARLMPSPEADRGAPIVGPDNVIESGNGRVQALQRAFERHPDRADAYRQQIEAAGFQIPPGVNTPVLIGRRTSDLTTEQRQAFVRRANTSAVARMSATERAAMDARSIDSDTLANFDPTQPIGAKGNVAFTRRFLNALPQAERGGLVDATGALNAEGVLRVRQALFARAFDAPDILARFAEADAGELRSLMDALEGAAPDWAAMRAAVAEGRVAPEFDITDFVLDAMRLIATAREVAGREGSTAAQVIDDMLNNLDLLEGATAPLTAALVRKFLVNGRAAPAAKITDFLRRYAAEAQKVGGTDGSLLDDIPGPLDVLKTLDRETFGGLTETGSTRVPNNPRPLPVIETEVIPESAFADGASSPEAIAAADLAEAQLRGEANPAPVRAGDRMDDLSRLVSGGASPAEIEAHPMVLDALAQMQARAENETRAVAGYGSDDWHATRQYVFSDESVTGTDAALKRWSEDAKSFAGTDGPAADRVATIILGPPASGKSSIAEELAMQFRAAILDSDEIKKTLPEYEGGIGAARVHEESSDLANELELALRSEGVNLIVPKVGGSPGSVRSAISRFKADGYQVRLVNMAVSTDEAYRRMIGRFISTGRIIPPDFVRSTGEKPSATFRVLKEEGQADGYAEIDNNPPRGAEREIREVAGSNPFEGTSFDLRRSGGEAVSRGAGARGGNQEGISPERLTSDNTDIEPGAEVRAQVAALTDGGTDMVLDLEDGTSVTTREILDDLDADDALWTVIDACNVGSAA
ncbi:zeta toxin family protein [Roseovarius mucosus]|uniref:phage tail tip lysozyme n=1 Tax=Roseovarius mucosus TaxID=215743 RepID=UPI001C5FB8B3|nr:phage tail tip lysozyme [Roseovarius mucosus]MBW4972077.1 zeta toxin family protein [Roseovarius mucosus]